MQKLVFVNGAGKEINLTSGNFGITNWEGLANTDLNIQTQQVPFEDGGVFLDALLEQREISVTVAIQDNNDLELRYQKKRELVSALNPKLGEGVLTYTNDYLSRQIKAVPQIPIFENKNSNDAGTLKASVAFTCCSPYWEDVEETEIILSVGNSIIIDNKGEIPTQLKIDMFPENTVTNPAIKNLTTEKKIEYNGVLQDYLKIDTNIGKKNVYKETKDRTLINCLNDIQTMIYSKEKSLYIAKSDYILLYSYNGEKWNISIEIEEIINSIVYANHIGKFIAVGNNGYVIESEDGINWQELDINETNDISTIVYSTQEHILLAKTNTDLLRSIDGRNWDKTTNGNYSLQYIENANLFILFNNGNIYTSEDGILWEETTNTGIYDYVSSICYSEKNGCYIGWYYPSNSLYKSEDLFNWTEEHLNYSIRKIIYSSYYEKFIAVCIREGDEGVIIISDDGNDFNLISNIPAVSYYAIIESIDHSIVIGGENGTIIKSENLTDWNIEEGGITDYLREVKTVAYSPKLDLFVIAGTYQALLYSKDGLHWNYKENIGNINKIIWIDKLNYFMGVGGNKVYKSYDGINWSVVFEITLSPYYNLVAITYLEKTNTFIIGGGTGPYLRIPVMYKSNGTNWQEVSLSSLNLDSNKPFTDISYVEYLNTFLAIGGGYILKSIDGENWEKITDISFTIDSGFIAYSNLLKNVIITVNKTGYVSCIIKTTNGIVWEIVKDDYDYKINMVCYAEQLDLFVCSGSKNNTHILLLSDNENEWEESNISEKINSSIYGKSKLLLIGGYQTIYQIIYKRIGNENNISDITKDSDMNLNLEVGTNELLLQLLDGNFNVKISYRQKYIGV